MKLHSVFGKVEHSQEAFDTFLGYLRAILEELEINLRSPPTIMPVVDLVQ